MTFFSSRWVDKPEHLTELDGTGLPAGFRAAGVAAQIKESGAPDVGLMVCDAPEPSSAARFTRSGVLAAPVLICTERCDLQHLRAVVVNSGNANAATGRMGFENAAKMQGAGALVSAAPEDRVAVASTGVIGVPLPMSKINSGILGAAHALAPDGDEAFSNAIQTTDAFPKRVRASITPGRGRGDPDRPGQGGGDDLAGLRHAAVLRADRRGAHTRDLPTCCSACASSAALSGSRWTVSCRPTTP